MGATEIIALDLKRSPTFSRSTHRLNQLEMTTLAFFLHETYLEMALAKAQGVPMHYIELRSNPPTSLWDFSNYPQLIQTGYTIASQTIADWTMPSQPEFARVALNM
jgi:hypothetical protein